LEVKTPWVCNDPEITRKVKVMFRKMAIAFVAASVFTAPVLAQNPPLSGGGTTSTPSSDTMEKTKPEKTEKSAESVEKSKKTVTKHHRTARHHRGAKAAKYSKTRTTTAMSGKESSGKTAKLAKTETRRMGHGKTLSKHVYGRASKRTPSGMTAH
jgi:hypothetical protein